MTPEGKVKKAVKDYLASLTPKPYVYMPVPMGYGATTLNFLVCHKGQFWGIETKRAGINAPTPAQACCMSDIAHAGGGVILENSVGCEKVRELIK